MTFWKKKDFEATSGTESGPTSYSEASILSPKTADNQPDTEGSTARAAVTTPAQTSQFLSDNLSKVRSALSAGTVIQGKLSFDTPVRIDGKLSGEVFSTDTLIVGESGVLDAKIEVQNLIVMGKVKGQISVKESLKLMRGAQLEGNINTHSISVEEGAFFNGKCGMTSAAKGEKAHTKIITFDSIESENKSEPLGNGVREQPSSHT